MNIPSFNGKVLQAGDDEYEESRTVTNACVDKWPLFIAVPVTIEDVASAVIWSRENGLELAVRVGGHAPAGFAIADGGLVIDLRLMKGVEIAPSESLARVGGGALWRDFDSQTQKYGLGTTGARVSSVGVAGFTLASGMGWFERRFGLATDNVVGATLVTSEGIVVSASASENEDLLWALRGGGGNFGVVTELEFRLERYGPNVLAGNVIHSWADVLQVAQAFRDAMAHAPRDVGGGLSFCTAPDLDTFPDAVRGKRVALIKLVDSLSPEKAANHLRPLREIGNPVADRVSAVPYVRFQSLNDGPPNARMRQHFECGFLHSAPDEALKALIAHSEASPSVLCNVLLTHFGGAAAEYTDGVLPRTGRQWAWQASAAWGAADLDDVHRQWVVRTRELLAPWSAAEAFPNLIADVNPHRVRASYGFETYERLARIKHDWDPENVFRGNHNITPMSTRPVSEVRGTTFGDEVPS